MPPISIVAQLFAASSGFFAASTIQPIRIMP
jgi:hypothetical protein